MSRNFTPKTFLLRAPNAHLREFFAERAPDMALDWEELEERDVDSILEAWNDLPLQLARDIENEFRGIHELACDEGIEVILQESGAGGHDLREDLETQDGMVAKAFWTRLHHPKTFHQALTFFEVDQLDGRSWRKRKDLPQKEPSLSADALHELKKALSAYYWNRHGRARRCEVHYLLRAGGLHYFFAYPEGYTTDILTYGDSERLERLTVAMASEVVFAFDPAEGSLNLFARGGRDLQDDLTLLFCRTILHEEISEEAPDRKVYELNVLKDESHAFPTEPTDRIEAVKIKRLRLSVVGKKEHRIVLDVDTRIDGASIHALMEESLDHERLPLTMVSITQATLQVVFRRANGRTNTVPFNITWPDKCNLSDKPDHLVIQKYLIPWKLENVKSVPTPVGQS